MPPTLYMFYGSPPSRAVMMTAKAIGLELILKEISLGKGEHLKPDYLKLNPQHTVPTLVDDDGFTIWESHAIMPYIIKKYGKNDDLYPTDFRKRAIIDQRMYFDAGVLFPRAIKIIRSIIFKGQTTIEEENKNSLNNAYGILEALLENKEWMAGDSLSIADFSIIASISSSNIIVPVDPEKFPKLVNWMKKCENLSVYDINNRGLQDFRKHIQVILEKKFVNKM